MFLSGLVTMTGFQTGVCGAIEEERNVTIQPTCELLASDFHPLAELVKALARDSEWAISPGSNTSGVVGAGTLHLNKKCASGYKL